MNRSFEQYVSPDAPELPVPTGEVLATHAELFELGAYLGQATTLAPQWIESQAITAMADPSRPIRDRDRNIYYTVHTTYRSLIGNVSPIGGYEGVDSVSIWKRFRNSSAGQDELLAYFGEVQFAEGIMAPGVAFYEPTTEQPQAPAAAMADLPRLADLRALLPFLDLYADLSRAKVGRARLRRPEGIELKLDQPSLAEIKKPQS